MQLSEIIIANITFICNKKIIGRHIIKVHHVTVLSPLDLLVLFPSDVIFSYVFIREVSHGFDINTIYS